MLIACNVPSSSGFSETASRWREQACSGILLAVAETSRRLIRLGSVVDRTKHELWRANDASEAGSWSDTDYLTHSTRPGEVQLFPWTREVYKSVRD